MNIRIGDKVKILDQLMEDYYGKIGRVINAEWTLQHMPLTMIGIHNQPKEIIAFEVKFSETLNLANAWFGEENLVAYK